MSPVSYLVETQKRPPPRKQVDARAKKYVSNEGEHLEIYGGVKR